MLKREPWFVAVVLALSIAAGESAAQPSGPTSSHTPYIVPTAPGWLVTSLITVGDRARDNGYAMAGIPDGLGAVGGRFDPDSGRYVAPKAFITVFMNHEIGAASGAVRAHGTKGAFVSQWTIDLNSLAVKTGEDLIRQVFTWDASGKFVDNTGTTILAHLCSADLPSRAAFFNAASGKGFDGVIFMNGEESGSEGRAFGHVASGAQKGVSYQLPYLGRFAWENAVAHPGTGDRTLVLGTDDSTPGQVYLYVGDKSASGNPVEKAGLHGGKLYGIKVDNGGANYANGSVPRETNGAIDGTFVLAEIADVAAKTGAQLQIDSDAARITEFARPEDAHWDTKDPNALYFVTTGAAVPKDTPPQTSKLYRLRFNDLQNPTRGTIEMLLDSASLTGKDGAAARSFDNLTVDGDGSVMLQEDPGNIAYIAKVWKFEPASGRATQVFESDRARFAAPTPPFTVDEESSGIIEVTDLVRPARWFDATRRYYLGVMQAHYPNGAELVEGGQLYLMTSPAARMARK